MYDKCEQPSMNKELRSCFKQQERTLMNSRMAETECPMVLPPVERMAPFALSGRLFCNGHVVIASLAIILALATASECQSIAHLPSLLYGVAVWGWWSCIASVFWKRGERVPFPPYFPRKAIAVYVVVGLALGVAHLLLLGSLGFIDAGWRLHATAFSILIVLAWSCSCTASFSGITGVIQLQIRAQREAMRSLELQRQLSAAHLRALQMQLEPHFLFNTLNAITTLVELGRQKAAAEMLSHLNALLKSTLARTTPEKVPLSQELEFVGNYLAIEQVRFADRLRVEMNVDPSAVDGLVPSFLLQPIVENAIRHGIARCEHNGLVEASAIRDGDELHLRVRDTGTGMMYAQQNGHGIGLSNTRERLDHFYQDGYRCRRSHSVQAGFEVAITIPYECQGI
jgi:signal transduction histidine kinase